MNRPAHSALLGSFVPLAASVLLSCAPAPRAATVADRSAVPELPALSLEEKVGQLVMVGADGVYLSEDAPAFRRLVRLVEEKRIGGIIWFRSDVLEAASLTGRLQKRARIPLFVSADLESNLGMRFPDLPWGPPAMAIAATGDVTLAGRRAGETARQARALGINQVYAPVADVNVNPDNPVINTRSYGEDPESVGRFVAAVVKGLQDGGVTATLKHFPGHGDTAVDSHRSLPSLPVDRARLDRVELVPFRAGIAAGARSVMVAHVALPLIEPEPAPVLQNAARNDVFTAEVNEVERQGTLPATVSPRIVDGILRRDLGFSGLVVTDSMAMGGIAAHFGPGEAAVRAFLAGCDVILMPADVDEALAALGEAVRSGRIGAERLDRSVRRILDEKRRLGLFDRSPVPLERIPEIVGNASHVAVEEEIARRSITLLRERAGALPFSAVKKTLLLTVGDDPAAPPPDAPLLGALKERFRESPGNLVVARLGPASCPADGEAVLARASEVEVVLLALYVRARSGSGTIAVPQSAKPVLDRLLAAAVPVVAVSFGSPYLIRDLPALETYLVAWGHQGLAQEAAARALFGASAIEGSLPVSIPGLAPRGSGIRKEAVR